MSGFSFALFEGHIIYRKRDNGLWRFAEDDKVVSPQPQSSGVFVHSRKTIEEVVCV